MTEHTRTHDTHSYPDSIYIWKYANDTQREQLEKLKESFVTFHRILHDIKTISPRNRLKIESRFCETVGLTTCPKAVARFHVCVVMYHLGIPLSQFNEKRAELEAYEHGSENLEYAERIIIDDTIAHLTRSLERMYAKHGLQ